MISACPGASRRIGAVLRQQGLAHLAALGERHMSAQMAQLAMHRHGDARPHPAIHLGQLVARRMAGDMDE